MKTTTQGVKMKKSFVLIALLLTLTFPTSGQTPEKGLEGVWKGVLEANGAQLRLVLTVAKDGGGFSGTLNSVDQGANLPIDSITVNGDAVRLEIKVVGGLYEGTLNKDRTELAGKWTQSGVSLPLIFKPDAASTQAGTKPTPAPAAAPPPRPLTVPFDIAAPVPPTAFKAGGKTHLVYELHITNFGQSDCILTRLEVFGAGENPLGRYEGNELASLLARPGTPPSVEKPRIGAGLRAVVYLWLSLEPGAAVPTTLRHRLVAKVGDFPEELSVGDTPVAPRKGVVAISPPLRGGEWLAANGPSNISGHRRALIPVDGQAHIAQRFAIDWVQLREDGRTFAGDQKENKNYRCYGAEALAVSDAVVVAVKDGIPENIPGPTSRAVAITLDTVGGNHVILDLGQGRFAFFAHLQPGSISVKVGDKVRRGQKLGLVGNSGNSTEPHLHFHISDANSPLASEGLPYAMIEYELQGKGFGWKPAGPQAAAEKKQMEMPLQNEVVRFPSTP
jgi:murein DD-endopeptidase MepM/ murein hydrolase activator NlpD